MASNILISFNTDGEIKVDYSGSEQTVFGVTDVQLIQAVMTIEAMVTAQTELSISELRELVDDERNLVQVQEPKLKTTNVT